MNEIRQLRDRIGITQAGLAAAAGTSQPTVAAYEAGQKSPTLATLGRLAHAVGLEAFIAFHPPLTREDRRSLALHRALVKRLMSDPEPVLERARTNLARMEQVAPSAHLLREWRLILERPLPAIADVMLDPSLWARELRHVTPFAGVLTGRERTALYRGFAASEQ